MGYDGWGVRDGVCGWGVRGGKCDGVRVCVVMCDGVGGLRLSVMYI